MKRLPCAGVSWGFLFALLSCVPLAGASLAQAAKPAAVAKDGRALMTIRTGGEPSKQVASAAASLQAYLGRITGASFEVTAGDGSSGIVVGTVGDFDALPFKPPFTGEPLDNEHYVLRSTDKGVWLIGATDLAVQHAVVDLLHRVGYRQYFPGETWEVVPSIRDLSIEVDADETPSFHARRIWYNWGTTSYNRGPYAQWSARNRAVKGFDLNSGHAYGAIIARNREAFNAHPEYRALVGGERKGSKFCVSNPGLRKLVADDAVAQVKRNPSLTSVSVDPSDGGGWCECEPCAVMGSVSDRALTLANEVAVAINALDLGPKYVGMYAYNEHSPPPAIDVHPNVIISATTAFIRGGFSLEQIVDGWKAKGATIGIYDYFSVIAWDWNLPRRARAARPIDLAGRIKWYHDKGARFFDAESGDAWGPYGLGYYVAARCLWDIEETADPQTIVDDFLTRAFGPAEQPMRAFYDLITVDNQRRSSADLIGRMYRNLAAAREAAADRLDVLARIDDLILYTRYAELYERFASATGKAKEQAKLDVLRHAYRMRETMMVHAYGLWARMASQRAFNSGDHPAASDEPITADEITTMLENCIEKNQPVELGFETVTFSDELVPAKKALGLPDVPTGSWPRVPQDRHTYHVWVDKAPTEIHLKVTVQKCGTIGRTRSRSRRPRT